MIEVFRRSASATIAWWQTQLECADDLLEQVEGWAEWFRW